MEALGYLGDLPLSFFGHSYGAYVALEIATQLKEKHRVTVDRLFLASSIPPHVSPSTGATRGGDLELTRLTDGLWA
jgi:surfactin synthase thioesterase subunit